MRSAPPPEITHVENAVGAAVGASVGIAVGAIVGAAMAWTVFSVNMRASLTFEVGPKYTSNL